MLCDMLGVAGVERLRRGDAVLVEMSIHPFLVQAVTEGFEQTAYIVDWAPRQCLKWVVSRYMQFLHSLSGMRAL